MFVSQKIIFSPYDFTSKTTSRFVSDILPIKSALYIVTLEKNVNAKSMLGLLTANIKKGDTILIRILNNQNQEDADNDLKMVLKALQGDL